MSNAFRQRSAREVDNDCGDDDEDDDDVDDDDDDEDDTHLSSGLTELQLVSKPGKLVCRVREVEHHEEVHPHLILLLLIMLMMMMTMTMMNVKCLCP